MKPLQLEDLIPMNAVLTLPSDPEKTYVLKRMTLAERIWMQQKYGKDQIQEIFETQNLPVMAEIAHHLIIDKTSVPTFMDFASKVVGMRDQIELVKALLATIGIDNELISELSKLPNEKAPPTE